MDDDTLFLETLRDIRERSDPNNPKSEYEVQKLAALLRKLFLDGQSLVSKVNRARRLPFQFRVFDGGPYHDLTMSMGPVFWSVQDGFDPDTALVPTSRFTEVNSDGLLARRIVLLNGEWYTVADIIRYVAHVEGAVHRSEPRDAKDQALATSGIGIGGYDSPVVRSLCAVGRVVVRGLEPLEARILAGRTPPTES
jgi:hypothetical protein